MPIVDIISAFMNDMFHKIITFEDILITISLSDLVQRTQYFMFVCKYFSEHD